MEAGTIDLIYIDPPFNTGTNQSRTRIRVERDEAGDRTGFQGARYRTESSAGTTGEAAARNGRNYILVDSSPEAARVMAARLVGYGPSYEGLPERTPSR